MKTICILLTGTQSIVSRTVRLVTHDTYTYGATAGRICTRAAAPRNDMETWNPAARKSVQKVSNILLLRTIPQDGVAIPVPDIRRMPMPTGRESLQR